MTKEQLNRGVLFLTKRAEEFEPNYDSTIRYGVRGLLTGSIGGAIGHEDPKKSRWGSALKGGLMGSVLGTGLGGTIDHFKNKVNEDAFNTRQEGIHQQGFLSGIQRDADQLWRDGIAKQRTYTPEDLKDPGIMKSYEHYKEMLKQWDPSDPNREGADF